MINQHHMYIPTQTIYGNNETHQFNFVDNTYQNNEQTMGTQFASQGLTLREVKHGNNQDLKAIFKIEHTNGEFVQHQSTFSGTH